MKAVTDSDIQLNKYLMFELTWQSFMVVAKWKDTPIDRPYVSFYII